MVDVGGKPETVRRARARASVVLPAEVAALFDGRELTGPKGPVFATARLAGIQAAKRTGELIPLCHPVGLDVVDVECRFDPVAAVVVIDAEAACVARTGVEMEALTAVSVAALTVIDMCKAVSPRLRVTDLRLVEKTGGRSDYREEPSDLLPGPEASDR